MLNGHVTLGPKTLDFFYKINEILQILDNGYSAYHFYSYCVIVCIFIVFGLVTLCCEGGAKFSQALRRIGVCDMVAVNTVGKDAS